MSSTNPLDLALDVAEIFEELVIPYVASSELASSIWREYLKTAKIEFIADLRLEKLPEFVHRVTPKFQVNQAAARNAIASQSDFTLFHPATGSKIQILLLKDDRFSQSMFSRHVHKAVAINPQRSLRFPALEDVLLAKLQQYRATKEQERQLWDDILWIIKVKNDELDFGYLRDWARYLHIRNPLDRALAEVGFDTE